MKIILILSLFILSGSCTKNYFDEFARKDTKEALFFDAKLKLNDSDYATAIANFDFLSANHPGYYADQNMVPLHASAFAGRCGLDFLTLLTDIQNAGTGALFTLLMNAFQGAEITNYTDCLAAENLLETIGDESARNGDENLLMAFVSLAKIGVILSSRFDQDNDGSADAGFDQCTIPGVPTDPLDRGLPTAEAREIGSGLSLLVLSLAGVGTNYIDVSEISTLCALDPDLAVFCSTTDPNLFTNDQLSVLRVAVGSNDIGIGSCTNGDGSFTQCLIGNPPPGCGP